MILLIIAFALPVMSDSTQSTNKIFLDPFYRASTTANTNYTDSLSLHPPDKISTVKSAIINFDVWMTPTVNFNAYTNGIACKNPTYTISTTYSGAGRAIATFDCSNIITQEGDYIITLRADKNTGAVTSWIDITYMNNPAGKVLLHGTEYIAGDVGKMFLQFLDANNNAVNNSECFLQVWYPNDTIVSGLNYTLMSHLNNLEEGIYYKNFNVPNVTGVYPASAKCYRPLTFYNIVLQNAVTENFETGTWTGGTGWSTCPVGNISCQNGWDVEDTAPLSTIVTNATAGTGGCYNGTYCAKFTGSYGFIERGVSFPDGIHSINFTYWTKFSGFQTNENYEFYIFDGNWHLLETIGANPAGGSYSNNVWYKHSLYLNESSFELAGPTLFGWYTKSMPSTGDAAYIDDISILEVYPNISISNQTEYQILRGSGEIHVSNLYPSLSGQIGNISSSVWNYPVRNLTYYEVANLTNLSDKIDALNQTMNYRFDNLTQQIANLQVNFSTSIANFTTIQASIAQLLNMTNRTLSNTETLLFTTNETLQNTNALIISGTQLQAGMNILLNDSLLLKNITNSTLANTFYLIREQGKTLNLTNLTYEQTIILTAGQSAINQSVNSLLGQTALLINITNATLQNTALTLTEIAGLNATLQSLVQQHYILEGIANSTLLNTQSLLNLSSYIVNLTQENTLLVHGLFNLTNLTYQNTVLLLSVTQSIKNDTTYIIGQLNNLQSDVDALQNDVSNMQGTINDIDARTIDIQEQLNAIDGNLSLVLSNIISLNQNCSSVNIQLTYIANDIEAILGNQSAATNLTPVMQQLDNITITLGGINANLSIIYDEIALINANISAQNLSAINQSLTGLIIAETGKPLEFDSEIVFLLIYIILLIVSVYVNSGGMYVSTGMYGIIYGLLVIPVIGFWFGLVAMAVGCTFAGIGINKMW